MLKGKLEEAAVKEHHEDPEASDQHSEPTSPPTKIQRNK